MNEHHACQHRDLHGSAPPELRDPVCGMTVRPDSPHVARHQNREYRFCSARCREKFAADPAGYLEPREAALAAAPPGATYTCPMHPEIIRDRPGSCPLCGMALEPVMPALDEGENPELVDFRRRFLWTLPLSLLVFVLAMFGDAAGLLTPAARSRRQQACRVAEHGKDEDQQRQGQCPQEAATEVDELRVLALVEGRHHGLQCHAAQRAAAGPVADDLGMHGAGIGGARRRGRKRGFARLEIAGGVGRELFAATGRAKAVLPVLVPRNMRRIRADRHAAYGIAQFWRCRSMEVTMLTGVVFIHVPVLLDNVG